MDARVEAGFVSDTSVTGASDSEEAVAYADVPLSEAPRIVDTITAPLLDETDGDIDPISDKSATDCSDGDAERLSAGDDIGGRRGGR